LFTGSVCQQVREWFRLNSHLLAGRRVLSGCCGNFTIETVLSQAHPGPAEIISNDVSLYSSALGAYFTGEQLEGLSVVDPRYEWVVPYLDSPLSTAAVIVVLLSAAPFSSGRTAYHRRIFSQFMGQFGTLHEKAIAQLKARREALRVSRYVPQDVAEFIRGRQGGDVFLSFMPTYAGGYERLYRFIDDIFAWTGRPSYVVMDADGKQAILDRLRQQGQYVHIDDMRRDEMPLVAIVQGGRSRTVYVHADLEGLRSQVYRRGSVEHKRPKVPVLGPDEVVDGDEVTFVSLTNQEFAWVRDQYLNAKIIPADPSWRFGVCLGGRLAGILGFARDKGGVEYYLLSDLAVYSRAYRRLSKLIVSVANTQEMRKLLRQQTGQFWGTFSTTAFTRRPVSMKYRGVLELRCRNEKEGKLTYAGDFRGRLSKEVKKWRKMEHNAAGSTQN